MAENISFLIDESEATKSDTNERDVIESDKNEVQQYEVYKDFLENDDMTPHIFNYQLNFTLRQLNQILDYYNIPKAKKCNKDILIQMIVHFESDVANEDIVSSRRMMWFYMDQLKNNNYMKRYVVLW